MLRWAEGRGADANPGRNRRRARLTIAFRLGCRRAAGTLRPGSPADLILLDTEVPWVLDPRELKSKSKNTPFADANLQGRVVRTIVAGRTVYEYV